MSVAKAAVALTPEESPLIYQRCRYGLPAQDLSPLPQQSAAWQEALDSLDTAMTKLTTLKRRTLKKR
jgi:hypothetical protein